MNYSDRYPSLAYLLRCYFNQDFDLLFGGAEGAIAAYKAQETSEEQLQMKKEIEHLLRLSLTDDELNDILLNTFDCNYYYPNEWNSSKEWLGYIHNQVS
ncbi:contact-dependent growth inhibition system immunity protein [Pantoea sp. Nvir]|uniref:contact-dependent growth inhibition system immunity protein n=1 Tax=Pantoea sp. Nvir TaxID=2576760 RepID=UPI0030D18AEF